MTTTTHTPRTISLFGYIISIKKDARKNVGTIEERTNTPRTLEINVDFDAAADTSDKRDE